MNHHATGLPHEKWVKVLRKHYLIEGNTCSAIFCLITDETAFCEYFGYSSMWRHRKLAMFSQSSIKTLNRFTCHLHPRFPAKLSKMTINTSIVPFIHKYSLLKLTPSFNQLDASYNAYLLTLCLPVSLLMTSANSLDPDQARRIVRPDQGPNCLTF